jgi:hypothetical protein
MTEPPSVPELAPRTPTTTVLLAYAVTQIDSLYQAMLVQADNGDSTARNYLFALREQADTAAKHWATLRQISWHAPDDLDPVIADARGYLTRHHALLDQILDQHGTE